MQIVTKELRETKVCLKIIHRKKYLSDEELLTVLKENDELLAIFVKSIKTAKSKL